MKQQAWEERLRKFLNDETECDCDNCVHAFYVKEMKSELQRQKREIVEMIRGMERPDQGKYCGCDGECFGSCNASYNNALDNIIKKVDR